MYFKCDFASLNLIIIFLFGISLFHLKEANEVHAESLGTMVTKMGTQVYKLDHDVYDIKNELNRMKAAIANLESGGGAAGSGNAGSDLSDIKNELRQMQDQLRQVHAAIASLESRGGTASPGHAESINPQNGAVPNLSTPSPAVLSQALDRILGTINEKWIAPEPIGGYVRLGAQHCGNWSPNMSTFVLLAQNDRTIFAKCFCDRQRDTGRLESINLGEECAELAR